MSFPQSAEYPHIGGPVRPADPQREFPYPATQNHAMPLSDSDMVEHGSDVDPDVCTNSIWPSSPPAYPRPLNPTHYDHDRSEWVYSALDRKRFDVFGDPIDPIVPIPMPQSPTSPHKCIVIEGDDLDAMGLFSDTDAQQLQLDLAGWSPPAKQRRPVVPMPDVDLYRAPDVRVYIAGQLPHEHNDVHRLSSVLTREVFVQTQAASEQKDICVNARLVLCTRNALYTICGLERINWAVQFLVNATEGLQYAAFVHQQQQYGHTMPMHDWKNATLYENAVAAGRLFLRLPDYIPNHAVVQPVHFFSPGTYFHEKLEEFRTQLAPNTHTPGTEEPRNTTEYRNKREHNNVICAQVSVYFLTQIFPLLFASDPNAQKLYQSSGMCQTQAHSHIENTIKCMVKLDKIAQQYNSLVARQYTCSKQYTPPGDTGCTVQIINGPRPWVIMQVIQMRLNANANMFDRCVSLALPFFVTRSCGVIGLILYGVCVCNVAVGVGKAGFVWLTRT